MIGGPNHIAWDSITYTILGFSVCLSIALIVAGFLCWSGKLVGRTLAFVFAILALLNFPIGTIVGILVIGKLRNPTFMDSLN